MVLLVALFRVQGISPVLSPVGPTRVVPVDTPQTLPKTAVTPGPRILATQILTQVSPSSTLLARATWTLRASETEANALQATPSAVSTQLPEFVMAYIPLNWAGDTASFALSARQQAEFFIQTSHMGNYFHVQVEILEQGLNNLSLSDENLLDKVIEFGLNTYPADRYIGLTDGDLVSGNSSDVVGWTYGPGTLGIVAESSSNEASAHELGHTFGLCDEYNYSYWKLQNETFTGGCPNPFPDYCEKDEKHGGVTCDGNQTENGLNSIMGPAGLEGPYAYNLPSLEYLQKSFESLIGR